MINSGLLKKWWFWVLGVTALGICIIGAYFYTKTSFNNYRSFSEDKRYHGNRYESGKQMRGKEYNLNEEAASEGMIMKVTAVKKSQGSSIDKPREGMQYIIVNVNIKNTGNSSLPVKLTDFQMRDDFDETAGTISTKINSDTQLKSGDVAAGAELNASIAFEVPSDTSNLTMLYKDNFSDNRKLLKFKVQ